MFDFKFLRSELQAASEDDYTPVNDSIAALLNPDYRLSEQDPQSVFKAFLILYCNMYLKLVIIVFIIG